MRLFSRDRQTTRALLAASLACLALALPAASPAAEPAAAARSPQLGKGDSFAPHLLLIHGGSFLYEDPFFEPLTRLRAEAAGFIPHYLTYPLNDLGAAVAAAQAEATELNRRYRGRLYAYGTSAGGTLAELLAGNGSVSAAVAKAPISDLIGWSWPLGAYGADYFERVAATPDDRRRLSPLRRPARRPLLIVHGNGDGVVPLAMSQAYSNKFARVHLWVVAGGHHVERRRPELLSRAFKWLAKLAR